MDDASFSIAIGIGIFLIIILVLIGAWFGLQSTFNKGRAERDRDEAAHPEKREARLEREEAERIAYAEEMARLRAQRDFNK